MTTSRIAAVPGDQLSRKARAGLEGRGSALSRSEGPDQSREDLLLEEEAPKAHAGPRRPEDGLEGRRAEGAREAMQARRRSRRPR